LPWVWRSLKKIEGILATYEKTLGILNESVRGCSWIKNRKVPAEARQSGYCFACTWEGDKKGLDYDLFRNSNLYGHPDCPVRCPIYTQKSHYRYRKGLRPTVEDLMPRLITVNLIFLTVDQSPLPGDRKNEG